MEERIDEICHSMRLIICIIVHFDQFLEIFTNENTMGIKIAHEREREREKGKVVRGGEKKKKKQIKLSIENRFTSSEGEVTRKERLD